MAHPLAVGTDGYGGRGYDALGANVAGEGTLRSNAGKKMGRHQVAPSIATRSPGVTGRYVGRLKRRTWKRQPAALSLG